MSVYKLSYTIYMRTGVVANHICAAAMHRKGTFIIMNMIPVEILKKYFVLSEQYGLFPYFILELSGGLRRGELSALLWSDVNVEANTVSITKALTRLDRRLVVSRPKTIDSVREVVIPRKTVDVLIKEHGNHPDNLYMFPEPKSGGMYDPRTVQRIHRMLLQQSGIEKKESFLTLRHVFNSVMMQHAIDPVTIHTMMGVRKSGTMVDVYAYAFKRTQQQAAEKMEGFLQQVLE